MELSCDKVGMTLQLHNLHSLPRLILANKSQASVLQVRHHIRVDLISVAMPFVDILISLQSESPLKGLEGESC